MADFELNFSGKNRPRPVFIQQKRTTKELHLGTKKTKQGDKNYYILGIDYELVWKQIADIMETGQCQEEIEIPLHKDAMGEYIENFKVISNSPCIFTYKGIIIDSSKIVMLGETKDYSPSVLTFCRPSVGKYFYDYANDRYEYYGIGIEDGGRMWNVIREVLYKPKYCIIYEA